MRSIKERYFIVLPLTLTDLVILGLKPPDYVKTDVKIPVDQAGRRACQVGAALFRSAPVYAGGHGRRGGGRYGIRVLYAPVLLDGTGEVMTKRIGEIFFLTAPPKIAADLPNSFLTRKQYDDLILPPEASGLPCYLAAQYENSKGDK